MDWRDPIGIAYALGAIACASVAVVAWLRRAHNRTLGTALTIVMAGAAWWAISLTVSAITTDETVRALAKMTAFVGPSTTCAAFTCLAFAVARPQWVPRRALVLALLVEPALITLAGLTNPWHEQVFRGAGTADLTGSTAWTYGPVFWIDTWCTYAEMLIGLGLIVWAWRTASPAFRGQRLAVFIAALVPFVANMVFLVGGFSTLMDPTPLGLAVTGTIVWYAVFRQGLFTFAPVARALIIDQIGDAVLVVSPAGKVLDLNPAAVDLIRGAAPDSPVQLIGSLAPGLFGRQGLPTAEGEHADSVVELPGGRVEYQVRSSQLVDRHRGPLGRVLVARDVTEANNQSRRLAAAHAQMVRQLETIESLRSDLVELASRDPLTGLHNRRHLVERFAALVTEAELTGEPLAVALFDVDHFKSINDDYGHLTGDAVLIALAQRIQRHTPPEALVARWGGEEFFVALPGGDAATGLAYADDVRRLCAQDPIHVDGLAVPCTLSGGVAAYPASGTRMNDLFHAADVSLYEAKNAGRNRVRLYQGRPPSALVDAAAAALPTDLEP